MLLAIDVGNTQTVVGVYEGDNLAFHGRFSTNKHHTSDEVWFTLEPLLRSAGIELGALDGVSLASVVPWLTEAWSKAVREGLGCEAVVCSARVAGDLFPNAYPNPQEIGGDRVADAVAARLLYGAPVIVVDFGTATNIEVVDSEGVFLGGAIAPGMDTAARALFEHATKLGAIEYECPPHPIGQNTIEAMQSGIVFGEADRVDGIVRRIFDQLGYEATVVGTGGWIGTVGPVSRTITEMNPNLTLEGLRLIYEAQDASQETASNLA